MILDAESLGAERGAVNTDNGRLVRGENEIKTRR